MTDLMCPARVCFARVGGPSLAPLLAGENVVAVYASPAARGGADGIAPPGVPVLADARLAEPGAAGDPLGSTAVAGEQALRSWLVDGELARTCDGETGWAVLARFAAVTGEIADRHRGEAVVVVAGPVLLSVGLAATCAGVRAATVVAHPLAAGAGVWTEYSDGQWRCAGWPAGAAVGAA